MRELIYRVYAISMLSENKITLYEDASLSAAQHFALHFDGAEKEIFIEKVYRLKGAQVYPSNMRSSSDGYEL